MSAVPTTTAPPDRARNIRKWALIIVTNLVSIVCLYYVLSGAQLNLIWGEIGNMSWRWVLIAVCADILVYVLQSWRWRLILKPVQTISLWTTIRAIYVGMFANEILPFRAGELIRCFLVTRWSEIPLSVSFASALIERIFDGIWLLICFFITLHLAELPKIFEKAGTALGVVVLGVGAILAAGMFVKQQSMSSIFGWPFPRWFNTLVEDLHLIGHSRYLYFAFLVSGLFMFCQLVPILGLIHAYGLDVDSAFVAAFTMMVLLRLSAVVPQAPGNLGLFQGVTFRTLLIFGVATAVAKRFSIILWAVVTIPLIVAGFLVLTLSGAKMEHLHREARTAAQSRQS